MNRRFLLYILAIFIISIQIAFAQNIKERVSDSSEIRKQIQETWFSAPLSVLQDYGTKLYKNSAGQTFQVHLEQNKDEFAIVIVPETTLRMMTLSNNDVNTVQSKTFVIGSPGTWILYRDITTGKPKRIRYQYCKDAEVFLEVYSANKNGTKTLVDMVVFDSYLAKGVQVGLPFNKFYTAKFEEIEEKTKRILPWQKLEVVPGMYHGNLQMIEVIRENLKDIMLVNEIVYDENDNLVYIKTKEPYSPPQDKITENPYTLFMSDTGFLKWIADGIAKPITGHSFMIEPLIEKTISYDSNTVGQKAVLSQKYSLNFSLDWNRNLATQIINIRYNKNYIPNEAGTDVTVNNFAAYKKDNKIVNATGFIKDTGYSIEQLKSLLYVLAVTEPNTFYFASIKERKTDKPDFYTFTKDIVLFPYFDDGGHFDCIVFIDCKEVKFNSFINNYSSSFAYLSRVKATDMFFPYTKRPH